MHEELRMNAPQKATTRISCLHVEGFRLLVSFILILFRSAISCRAAHMQRNA